MDIHQRRLSAALDQLDITHGKLGSLIVALDHLLDAGHALTDGNPPLYRDIMGLRHVIEDYTDKAEADTQAVWKAAKPLLRSEVRDA